MLLALKRLENEGLVEIIPQVGCRVLGPSARTLEELFSLRAALEGVAAEAASTRLDDAGLGELAGLLAQLDAAAEREDARATEELDARFHLGVIEASGLPHVVQAGRSVWSPLRSQLARLPAGPEAPGESGAEHREILEALARHAPRRARAAAERHARLSGDRLFARLPGAAPRGLVHRALVYRGDEEFLTGATAFVNEGLDAGERVLAVTTEHNTERLARALDGRAAAVEFRDSREWYHVPSHALLAYHRYVSHADSDRVRIVGEPVWSTLSAAAVTEWTRYESLLNVELAPAPASILCPYDAAALPEPIVASAARTHPEVATAGKTRASRRYAPARRISHELDGGPFDEPPGRAAEHPVTRDLAGVRQFAIAQAHAAGVAPKRLVDALLAVQEVAANAIQHGAGEGRLRSWVEDGQLVYEVSDRGPGLTDPLVAHMTLDPGLRGEPRGLWIARLLCDLVEVRSHRDGFAVRLHVAVE